MAQERILIVDDDITLSEILKMRLESMGYLVDCARSGNQALEVLKSRWVDLIILSVVLQEGIHGYQVFREIKNKKKFAKIPIIVQSSKPAMKKTFEKMGAQAFFVKPYSMELFLNKIKDTVSEED